MGCDGDLRHVRAGRTIGVGSVEEEEVTMRVVLAIVAVLALAGGVLALLGARSAVHEIEALICFLIFTVALGIAGVIDVLVRAERRRG